MVPDWGGEVPVEHLNRMQFVGDVKWKIRQVPRVRLVDQVPDRTLRLANSAIDQASIIGACWGPCRMPMFE